jgi:hypothetical protein
MKKHSLLVGTSDEILKELMTNYNSPIANYGTIREQIERIAFEGALMENSAMGMIVYMAMQTDEDKEIPMVSLGVVSQYVCITGDILFTGD